MGHLIADILFLAVGVGLILVCAKRGLLKSAIHFCKTLLAFVFAYLFGSKLGQFICEKWISAPVHDWVRGKLDGIYQQTADGLSAEKLAEAFPDFVMTEEVKASLQNANGSGEQFLDEMTSTIATPAASVISNIIGYVVVFVVSIVLLWVAAAILTKLIEHIGFLHTVNTVLGGVLGFLVALIVLFVAASVIRFLFGDTPLYTDSLIVKLFGESKLLENLKFLDFGKLFHQ